MKTRTLELIGEHWPYPGTYQDQPRTVQEQRLIAIETRELAVSIGARMMAASAGKAKRGR